MTDLRTAAQQALEALESTQLYSAHEHYPRRRVADALAALRAALEQPEQEPKSTWQKLYEAAIDQRNEAVAEVKRLLEQPEQEPVAWLYHDARTPQDAHPWLHSTMLVLAADRRPGLRGETPLFTHPPRRDWRGLDRDETMHLMNDTAGGYWADEAHIQRFARAIEAALKERNA